MALTPDPPKPRPRLQKAFYNPGHFGNGRPNPKPPNRKGIKNKRNQVPGLRILEATRKERNAEKVAAIKAGRKLDAAAKDLTPLGFMEEVLRRPSEYPTAARMWAAKEAAPYIHRKQPIAIETGPAPEDAATLLREHLAAMELSTSGSTKE